MRAERGYETITIGERVGVRAWGTTIAEAFAEAAQGVFAMIVDPARVDAPESREVRAQGASVEALLLTWINECLYVYEIEGFVAGRVHVDTCAGGVVHGTLFGEELDGSRHRPSAAIKGAIPEGIDVAAGDSGFSVRVMLDGQEKNFLLTGGETLPQ